MKTSVGCLLLTLLLACGYKCHGQDTSATRKNLLKLDLFGPAISLPTPDFRASVEYERKFSRIPGLSFIVDAEYRIHRYEFQLFYTWPPDWGIPAQWVTTRADQKNVSAIFGLRYSHPLFRGKTKRLQWFAEPRFEVGWAYARFALGHTSGYKMPENAYILRPRLRGGVTYLINDRLGLEGSVDGLVYRFLGNGNHVIQVIAELNIVYWF